MKHFVLKIMKKFVEYLFDFIRRNGIGTLIVTIIKFAAIAQSEFSYPYSFQLKYLILFGEACAEYNISTSILPALHTLYL